MVHRQALGSPMGVAIVDPNLCPTRVSLCQRKKESGKAIPPALPPEGVGLWLWCRICDVAAVGGETTNKRSRGSECCR